MSLVSYNLRSNAEQTMPEKKGKKQPAKEQITLEDMFARQQDDNSEKMAANTNNETSNVTNAELKDLLLSMDRRLNARMDAIEAQLKGTVNRVTENENKIKDLVKSVEHNDKFINQILKEQIPDTNAKIFQAKNEMRKNQILAEIHDRKLNLLFYGVKQTKDEDIYDVVREFLITDFMFRREHADSVIIVNAHRLPRRKRNFQGREQQEGEERPDPIIVRFGCMSDRDCVLEASQIRGYIKERKPVMCYTDLPAEMKRTRGELAAQARILRNEGNSTRIRVNGVKVYLEYRAKEAKGSPWKLYTE